MYEELVAELRNLHRAYVGTGNGTSHHAKIILQAADAIEKLSRRIERAVDLYNRNVEKTAMYEALIGLSPEPSKEETE